MPNYSVSRQSSKSVVSLELGPNIIPCLLPQSTGRAASDTGKVVAGGIGAAKVSLATRDDQPVDKN